MRPLHIASSIDPKAGGPAMVVVGLARAQAAAGCEVAIAAPQADGAAEILRNQPNLTVHNLNWNAGVRDQLRPLVRQCDVAHIYGLWEPIQHHAAVVCREAGKPYIFEPCGMLDRWALRRSRLKKWIYMKARLRRDLQSAAAIHASTSWERDQTAPLKLRPPIVVVPAGIELAEFEQLPPRGTFRARFPALQNKPVILFLGRVFPGKGLEMLVPALARMRNKDATLAVVGPDSDGYTRQMRNRAAELGIEDRVIFTGMARGRERIEALVDADLFSLPSEHENFGVAVLEAMAAGVPVIVSDQVGLCNDITEARAGEAVPLDVDRLAEALDRWLADDSLRKDAGARARELAFGHFTWDLVARQWIDVYRELRIIA